jgi:hypothetical protein
MVAIEGLLPIVATPFDHEGGLDETSFHRLVEFLVDAGADGLGAVGLRARRLPSPPSTVDGSSTSCGQPTRPPADRRGRRRRHRPGM